METFYWRHPFWSQSFRGLHFPTMALYIFCDQLQKMPPPPPDLDPPSGAKTIFNTGLCTTPTS